MRAFSIIGKEKIVTKIVMNSSELYFKGGRLYGDLRNQKSKINK